MITTSFARTVDDRSVQDRSRFQGIGILLLMLVAAVGIQVSTAHPGTADHSQFDILKQDFASGPDVTKACLTCHTEAAKQVHKTIHWTWICPKSVAPQVGKAIVVNNFCIALQSNERRCTSCHAGYGWEDQDFDFSSEENVDCLVCHDQTGEYEKFPAGAGHPVYEPTEFGGKTWQPPDLSKVAQSVGRPSRHNCGVCHFYGGGGEGVKHADLDESLENPRRSLDVHMDREGPNMQCVDCHTTKNHEISGRCYAVPAAERHDFHLPISDDNRITCVSCHSDEPHPENEKLNDHIDKVACQTCHIPYAAREKATKHWWDWSKAGRLDENGQKITITDSAGNIVYSSQKGEFAWSKNFVPEYFWFNGSAVNTLVTDFIDDSKPVPINRLRGSIDDPNSRIYPVKVHRGKQVYDPVNKRLVVPKLYGPKGSGAYWSDFDWHESVKVGMEYVDLPWSGEVGFVETEMFWPITHMVAPAEDAVGCAECHSSDGRLASLSGFYMPGRDRSSLVDALGWLSVMAALFGVGIHGSLRVVSARRRRQYEKNERNDEEQA